MTVEFIDTSILIYAEDSGMVGKHQVAVDLVARLARQDTGALSTQVLTEYYNAAMLEIHRPTRAYILHLGCSVVTGFRGGMPVRESCGLKISATGRSLGRWRSATLSPENSRSATHAAGTVECGRAGPGGPARIRGSAPQIYARRSMMAVNAQAVMPTMTALTSQRILSGFELTAR